MSSATRELATSIVIGCDVGGTFVDAVAWDQATGRLEFGKVPTPRANVAEAIIDAVRLVTSPLELDGRRHGRLVHGTTLVLNALLGRTGAEVGLIATCGFGDTLELRRHVRPDIYSIHDDLPEPIVPRNLVREVEERMTADGRELVALNRRAVETAVGGLLDVGAESLAICFLHAYANPLHERQALELVKVKFPGLPVSASHDVAPKAGEFERMSTTAADAYVKPLVSRYLGALEERVRIDRGGTTQLSLMLSNGGLSSPDMAGQHPVELIESGPIGGVIAAREHARRAGVSTRHVLSFDIGGTTAKASLITDGETTILEEYEIARSYLQRKGSGLPIAVPSIDIVEVGMGGGSIARLTSVGTLAVGPDSAGSDPGPASFGRGGTEATLTDADVVAGFIATSSVASIRLAPDRARQALAERVGRGLDLDDTRAACAVVQLADESMARAVKEYLAERGADPRSMTMVAFGGAGPVHAYNVARRVGIGRLLIPPGASVFSAIGFLMAPPRVDLVRTVSFSLAKPPADRVRTTYHELRREAFRRLASLGIDEGIETRLTADVMYAGQRAPMRVSVEPGWVQKPALFAAEVRQRFEHTYAEANGRSYPHLPVIVGALRVTALSAIDAPSTRYASNDDPVEVSARRAYSSEDDAFVEFAVVSRRSLIPGKRVPGPVLVEDYGTMVVIDSSGSLELEPQSACLVVTVGSADGSR